jgi:hypothetical protein
MNRMTGLAALLLGIASQTATAAPVTYTFDVVSKIYMHESESAIIGVLVNTVDPVTIKFPTLINPDVLDRCVPMFLTAIEKPGRYYLSIRTSVDPGRVRLLACGLELRT